jgi:hypothetical protein
LGGEVHGDKFAIPSAGEDSTVGVEAHGFVAVKRTGFPKRVSAGECGVSAKIHLAHGGEPAERESIVYGVKEGGFGKVEFAGNTLHPIFAARCVEKADSGRVPTEGG